MAFFFEGQVKFAFYEVCGCAGDTGVCPLYFFIEVPDVKNSPRKYGNLVSVRLEEKTLVKPGANQNEINYQNVETFITISND